MPKGAPTGCQREAIELVGPPHPAAAGHTHTQRWLRRQPPFPLRPSPAPLPPLRRHCGRRRAATARRCSRGGAAETAPRNGGGDRGGPPSMTEQRGVVRSFLQSALAACVAEAATLPFDTAKVPAARLVPPCGAPGRPSDPASPSGLRA